MEGIISILILTILMATFTSMIMVSLRMTHAGLEASNTMQESTNAVVSNDGSISDPNDHRFVASTTDVMTFTLPNGWELDANVYVRNAGNFTLFEPQ